ncbi:MAG: hypothetical protein AAF992_17735 [Bacteroidota bacterium]
MNAVKIAAGFAGGITILLVVLALNVKNPETALYDKTVEMLMKQEGVTSELELKKRFPELIDIKSTMSQVTDLNQTMQRVAQNPAPMMTEEESWQMEHHRQRMHQLRHEVRAELSQLIVTYAERQP